MKCPTCKQTIRKPLRKVSRKKTVRNYENGVKDLGCGRELCMTQAAWDKRKDEVFARDKEQDGWWICATCKEPSEFRHHFEVDHIRKRSLRGGDQLSNLQLLCAKCHRAKHDEFR